MRVPNGLRYHIIDIYVDELDRLDTPRSGKLPIDILLSTLRRLGTDSPTKTVRLKVKEALEDARLGGWNCLGPTEQTEETEQRDVEEEEWDGIDD